MRGEEEEMEDRRSGEDGDERKGNRKENRRMIRLLEGEEEEQKIGDE